MKRSPHAVLSLLTGVLLLGATLSGCASRPQSHEGNLIDNKVTAQRVQAALRKAGPEFRHVVVHASKDGVTLKGKVGSEQERRRAEEIARGLGRTVDLTNQLTVGR